MVEILRAAIASLEEAKEALVSGSGYAHDPETNAATDVAYNATSAAARALEEALRLLQG